MVDGGDGGSTIAVMADPQSGIARVLKPELNFETLFQGQQAEAGSPTPTAPIPFFEWKGGLPPDPRDPVAGRDGFDPDLLSMLPVSMGAQLLFAFPVIGNLDGRAIRYRYRISWRWTSLARQLAFAESQYHLPNQQPGAPDGTTPLAPKRFVLPAAQDTLLITSVPTPLSAFTDIPTFVEADVIINDMDIGPLPLISKIGGGGPPVFGHFQQGLVDPTVFATNYPYSAVFALVPIKAKADHLIITCDRPESQLGPMWDFADGGTDVGFSLLYGNGSKSSHPHPPFPDVGIYVWQVTVPHGTDLIAGGFIPSGIG